MHFWEGHMKISIQSLILLFVFGSHSLFAAGDAEAGKAKSAPCAACHGADGNSVNPAWPKLAGQGAPYIYMYSYRCLKTERVLMHSWHHKRLP